MPRTQNKNSKDITLTFDVLGYYEDDEWCALALDMDLRGHGTTFENAIDDLQESIAMQVGFAQFKNDPDLIFRPAEPLYYKLFAEVRGELLRAQAWSENIEISDYQVADIPLPPPHVIAEHKKAFAPEGA